MKTKSLFAALFIGTVLAPASAMAMASAELYSTTDYLYGRFEARIQYAPGDGVVSSFFLWKEGSDAANAYWNELDYEKVGAGCTMQINNIYGNPKVQHQPNPTFSFNLCSGYHDYRFEWTPDYIAWSVDEKEIRRDTGAAATAYSQNAASGMSFHFNIWPGNSTFGGNINNTTLPVHQYISWVQYSSYANGAFNVQWREDFQSSTLPSGWATGNWSSPFNLSTHSPQNVAFVNGIAVLSLTADNATGAPGTPPVDPTATGGSSGAAGSGAAGKSGTGGATSTGGTKGTGGIIGDRRHAGPRRQVGHRGLGWPRYGWQHGRLGWPWCGWQHARAARVRAARMEPAGRRAPAEARAQAARPHRHRWIAGIGRRYRERRHQRDWRSHGRNIGDDRPGWLRLQQRPHRELARSPLFLLFLVVSVVRRRKGV